MVSNNLMKGLLNVNDSAVQFHAAAVALEKQLKYSKKRV